MINTILTYAFGQNYSGNPVYMVLGGIYGLICSFGAFCFGTWVGLIWILLAFIVFDTIVGILAAKKEGETVTSETFIWLFFVKMIIYMVLIFVGVGLDRFLDIYLLNGIDLSVLLSELLPFGEYIGTFLTKPFTVIITSYLIIKETWSIMEHLTLLDSKIIPKPVKDAIKKLMDKFNPEDKEE